MRKCALFKLGINKIKFTKTVFPSSQSTVIVRQPPVVSETGWFPDSPLISQAQFRQISVSSSATSSTETKVKHSQNAI